jgi:Mrp family chromosome partitioning ATPase
VGVDIKGVVAKDECKRNKMENVKHTILVLSGKGGVGKSSIAVNLAIWLSMQGKNVGLLDIDIHGPSIPKLLHLEHFKVQVLGDKMIPAVYSKSLKIMSVGFLLRNNVDAVIWRGPMKHNVIKQFVTDVLWGDLDYLVTDCPPGTGDEPLSIAQFLGKIDGAVIVTTPQQIAVVDVKKCITFCRQLNLPIFGVIENMSGFVCPHCNQRIDVFAGNGGQEMAKDFGVPFLGKIPMDPGLAHACDLGSPFIDTNRPNPTAGAMRSAFEPMLALDGQQEIESPVSPALENKEQISRKEKKT